MACRDSCCQPDPGITSYVLSRRQVKATRKPHACAECGREIAARSSCQTLAALVDGTFYAEYRHHPYDPACYGYLPYDD